MTVRKIFIMLCKNIESFLMKSILERWEYVLRTLYTTYVSTFFMLSSDWLWSFLKGGSKIIRFAANAQRLDSLVFILVNSLQSLSWSELTGQKTSKFYHCAYGKNWMTNWKNLGMILVNKVFKTWSWSPEKCRWFLNSPFSTSLECCVLNLEFAPLISILCE